MLLKICGLTRSVDVELAVSLGADYVGVILAGGPRALTPDGARVVLGQKRHSVRRVAVFGGQPLDEIARISALLALDVVQLHGHASASDVQWLRSRAEAAVWPVVRLDGTTLPAEAFVLAEAAGALLLDARVVGQLGGTGVALDWLGLRSAVSALRERVPGVQLVLAGGLRAGNLQNAWDMLSPAVADVSSGVEIAPGLKDPSAMAAFVKAGRNVTLMNTKPTVMMEIAAAATDRFGQYGGRYVPETLIPALDELEQAYDLAMKDADFRHELDELLREYVGRPSPLTFAPRLSERIGAQVWLKREDLNHTGAHKINNTVGQALLALRMGKKRIVAETGAGQHGVATATICARFGLECVVYMGEEDMRRQELNVFRMRLLGATVIPVLAGTRTLKDATTEAIRDWVTTVNHSHYIIGSVVGPAPYPRMVREFQSVIGTEARAQLLQRVNVLPRTVVACVGGGSNAMGIFAGFVDDAAVELIGVEAAGDGLETDRHSASLTKGRPGVLHGALSYLLQDEHGQVHPAHSISAGLDYPGVGPEHSFLKDSLRAEYVAVTDTEALHGVSLLSRLEGIIPALETAHAVAWAYRERARWQSDEHVLLCISGRGDKDVATLRQYAMPEA